MLSGIVRGSFLIVLSDSAGYHWALGNSKTEECMAAMYWTSTCVFLPYSGDMCCIYLHLLTSSPFLFPHRHIGHVGWDPNTGFDVSAKQECIWNVFICVSHTSYAAWPLADLILSHSSLIRTDSSNCISLPKILNGAAQPSPHQEGYTRIYLRGKRLNLHLHNPWTQSQKKPHQ